MKREILLLLLRCLNTEPELCPAAVEATAHDPEAHAYAEALIRGSAALALPAPLPATAAPRSRSSRP